MAHFGSPWAAGFGRPDNHLSDFKVRDSTTLQTLLIDFTPADQMGDAYFGVYKNGSKISYVFAAEGSVVKNVPCPRGRGLQDVQVLREGHGAEEDLSRVAKALELSTASTATLQWTWPSELMGTDQDLSYLTSWALSPLYPESLDGWDRATRRSLSYALVVSGGVATVTLSAQNVTIGTGSGAVGTTITITGEIAGTVDVDLLALDEEGSLITRYPRVMVIHRGVKQYNAPFEGNNTTRWTDPEILDPGGSSYSLQTLSDTETFGPLGAPVLFTIPDPPEPITELVYTSGDSTALRIDWTASATVGATYNVYVQFPSDPYMNLQTPIPLPAGTTNYTLDPVPSNPGITHVMIRATDGGVEERKGAEIYIETDALGDVVSKRPNNAALGILIIDNLGGDVIVSYCTAFQEAAPSHGQVFLRVPGGVYDFTSPDGEAVLVEGAYGLLRANVSFTKAADGFYYMACKARTSAGVQSPDRSEERKVFLSNDEEAAPSFDLELTRS